MTQTRRTFLATASAAGAITVLPFVARADAHGADSFASASGSITIHPVAHASFVMQTPAGVIYVDPVGEPAQYDGLPPADLILITHEHGDHFNADTLSALTGEGTHLIVNPAVGGMLPLGMEAEVLANGEAATWNGVEIGAIAAHNTTEERMNYHPIGRDNGYVLTIDGFRTYISGDTEPTADMLALENIDLAFLCMNLPFTMTAVQAAEAVQSFRPSYVYPYHYRGRDGGSQDPAEFAALVGEAAEVKMGAWYAAG